MNVCIIQFKQAGKRYYFDPKNLEIQKNDLVVVETIRGLEIGRVLGFEEVNTEDLVSDLKPILRVASQQDILNHDNNLLEIPEIVITTKDLVVKHKLNMSVLDAEYTLDKKRLLIYFEADDRVDFRELVKDLSIIYATRIELRQIGSRDGAKLVGGIGPCGLILCCNTFLGDFETITIRMAKNQNMSLNPSKISGLCDKLLCCIKYENDTYSYLKEILPDINDEIIYQNQKYLVKDINLLKEKVLIHFGDDQDRVWLKKDEYKKVK